MNETQRKYLMLMRLAQTAATMCYWSFHRIGGLEWDTRARDEYQYHLNTALRFRIYLAAIS